MLVMRRMSKGALKSKITNALKGTSELLTGFCPWNSLEDWCRILGPNEITTDAESFQT